MKLLRLLDLQAANTGSMSFNLNEPLVLEPDSQVALQECTLDLVPQQVVVTASNQTINYSTQALNTAPQVATLTPGNYSTAALVREVERAMNAGLNVASGNARSAIGFQWKVSQQAGKSAISYNRNDPLLYEPRISTGCTWDPATQIVTKTNASTVGFAAWTTSQIPFCRGAGYYCGVVQVGATADICLGLSADKALAACDPSTFAMAVSIEVTTQNYYIQVGGGALTDTGVTAAVGDLYGFRLTQGQLSIIYRRAGVDTIIGAAVAFDYTAPLFPVMAMMGPAGATMALSDGVYHCIDPFYTAVNDDPVGAKPQTTVTLHFENPLSYGAADLLGFTRALERIDAQGSATFTSQGDILATPERLSLLILLESLPSIQAYDSLSGGRRPILATISSWLEKGGTKVEYQPNQTVWLDVNNEQPLPLSTFRVRVVDTANNAISLGDGCSFTLLFK